MEVSEILSMAAGGCVPEEPSFRHVMKSRIVTGAKQFPNWELDIVEDTV
jgi:hypothetical protein